MIPTTFYIPGKGWHTATTPKQFRDYEREGQAFGSGAKQFDAPRRHGQPYLGVAS